MLPLTVGMLFAGPTSGYLSDRFGARAFATAGCSARRSASGCCWPCRRLPVSAFAAILPLIGLSMGMFASPNRAAVMNSLPPGDRGAGGGMNQTFQNSAQVLSIGIFFTLMIIGLAATLPHAMATGPRGPRRRPAPRSTSAMLPPVSILFAAFLGYNPIQHLRGPACARRPPAARSRGVTGRAFFPQLISGPFRTACTTLPLRDPACLSPPRPR